MAPHILDLQVPEVEPTGAPGGDFERIRSSPEMFGGFGAEAAKSFGGGLEKAGEAGINFLTQRNQLNNQIGASEIHSWFSDQGTDASTQFYQKRGKSALEALPEFKSKLEDLQSQAEGRAGNNLQLRSLISVNTRRELDYFYQMATRHANSEYQTYATNTANNNITSAVGLGGFAAMNGDLSKLDEQVRRIGIEAHNYFDPFGYDKDTLDAEVSKKVGSAVKNWVESAATNQSDPDNLTTALKIFERYSPQMDAASRLDTSKWINAKAHARTVEHLSDYYMAMPGRTIRSDLSPEMRGLLDTIAGGETTHAGYNELYTGKSVESVNPKFDYSDHPRIFFPAQYGPTSAFGRYQITSTTWNEDKGRYGLSDISPESQDTWAAKKASELYSRGFKGGQFAGFPNLTGNLDQDLKANANDPRFLEAVGHTVSHEWTSAPGGLQPNQQTGSWTQRFQHNIAVNRGDTALPDADMVFERVNTDPLLADRPELKNDILRNLQTKLSMAQRQETLAQKQAKQQSDDEEFKIFQRIHGGDPTITPGDIWNNPLLTNPAKERKIKELEAQPELAKFEEKGYGSGFYDAYTQLGLPVGNPDRISDVGQIYDRVGPTGNLTPAGASRLIKEMQARKTPEGQAESQMMGKFLQGARGMITGTDKSIGVIDPKGDRNWTDFLAFALTSYDQAKVAGKTPAELLNPNSPNYIGKAVENFVRSKTEMIADRLEDHPEATPDKTAPAKPFDMRSIRSLADLKAAYLAGNVSKAQADDMAVANGWATRKPVINYPNVPQSQ